MDDLFSSFSNASKAFYDARHSLSVELSEIGCHDLTPERALIMVSLAGGAQTVNQIARNAYFGANVSYNVRSLDERGYVEVFENPQDRRSKFVRLTVAGREVLNRLNGRRSNCAAVAA